MSETILEIHDLSFGFDKNKELLHQVSLSIRKGEFCILAGPNGSGKSLLLKNIKGLLQQKAGTILIDELDVSKKQKTRRKKVGLVFQDADSQIIGQTVEKDILFGLENMGVSSEKKKEKLNEIASLMELTDLLDRRPRTLSGGEKRRLAIAGVLAMEPSLVFMDEPFANLDYKGTRTVLATLQTLKESGHTIVIVSHEIEKVAALSDRIMVIENGSIVVDKATPLAIHELIEHDIYVPTIMGKPLPVEEMTWLKQ